MARRPQQVRQILLGKLDERLRLRPKSSDLSPIFVAAWKREHAEAFQTAIAAGRALAAPFLVAAEVDRALAAAQPTGAQQLLAWQLAACGLFAMQAPDRSQQDATG